MSSEVLEQMCMENTQILPWIWVVESLASSKSVDTSLLIQLAKIIPEKYGELGKNAREAVSLRILESLAARDVEDNDGISDERIEFDPSESCEDVLRHILDDVPASDFENGGLKMLKWDVRSFIAGKRACLNGSFLQKLKEAILEGNHSVLESLKERSGIAVITQYNNNILANDGHSNELVPRLKIVVSSKTSNPVSAEECDDEMKENVPERNFLPAKRNRSHVTVENAERRTHDTITTEEGCDLERDAAKKHKKGEDFPSHDNIRVTMTSSQYEIPIKPLENVMENVMENVETEMHMSDKEAEVVESPNDREDQEASLRIPENPVVKDVRRNLCSQMLGQNDKIGEGYEPITSIATLLPLDEAMKFIHEYHASDAAEANDHIEHDQDPEGTGNSDDYHDKTNDVVLQKDAFLSSQCPFSQEFLATQLKLCMKCNNGGKLLVCSTDTCPIVVHESCLGSTANLNCEDWFYCPFCAYSRAISEYLEVRKRATLARKKLAIFIGQKAGNDKSNVNESKRDDINHTNRGSNLEDRRKTKPRDTPPCKKIVKELALRVEARHDRIETIEDESDQSFASTYSQRSTKMQNLHTNGGVTQTMNKEKLPWTNAEVEKLKEGVEKFRYADGMIPWMKILEYGADVFNKCRGRLNLKHKWKAMNRSSPIKR